MQEMRLRGLKEKSSAVTAAIPLEESVNPLVKEIRHADEENAEKNSLEQLLDSSSVKVSGGLPKWQVLFGRVL